MKDNHQNKKILVRFPLEVIPWLEARAKKNNRSRVGEILAIIVAAYKRSLPKAEVAK